MALFQTNSEKLIDAERFSSIVRGLHVSTTIEEKFEEVQAVYNSNRSVTLLYKISQDFILVNGPNASIDVLSTKDLKVQHNLSTDGEIPFSACKVNNHLFIGCNRGHVFIFDTDDGYKLTGHQQLRDKVSCMKELRLRDAADTRMVICCQYTGHIDILAATAKGESKCYGFHNTLSNIFKIEPVPTREDNKFKFVLATNNGVVTLAIMKDGLKQSLTGEKYCVGQVINNLIVSGNHVLAFQHGASAYSLINRDKKEAREMKWPIDKKTCITGAMMTPDFHADENSYIFIKDERTVKLINTQTWICSELVEVGEGLKYPDL